MKCNWKCKTFLTSFLGGHKYYYIEMTSLVRIYQRYVTESCLIEESQARTDVHDTSSYHVLPSTYVDTSGHFTTRLSGFEKSKRDS